MEYKIKQPGVFPTGSTHRYTLEYHRTFTFNLSFC